MTDSQPRDDREKKHQKQHEKNGNYCDCNRKNAIKFGGFKKKLYLCSRIPFHTAWERKFFSSRRGYVPCCGRDTGHNKRRLTRFVLAVRNLVNSIKFQNIAALRCP